MEIIYGIRNDDGKVVSIDEIPNDKPGLQCNCVCTYCKGALQACSLNGLVRRYFRHHTESAGVNKPYHARDCNSYSANETALHLMAKQIIEEEKKILVPPKNISIREAGIIDIPLEIKNKIPPYELQKARCVLGEDVKLEEHLKGFTPDVMLKTSRGELLIEICVSHRVDDRKKEKAEEHGSAMLEIDLSNYVDTTVKSDELKAIILTKENHKKWIYYPLSDEALNNARRYYNNHDALKKHRAYVLAEKRRLEKEEAERERRNQKIKELFKQENYAAALECLRDDDAFLTTCEKWHKDHWFSFAQHYRQYKEVPFFIDIPISGEMIFKCDRRIWQSIVFNRYIYGRKEDSTRINVNRIFDALKKDYNIGIDYDLTYKLTNPKYEKCTIWLREEVVCKYMDYLEEIGFITSSFDDTREDWRTVLARRTIDPPLREEANKLFSAIQSVNSQSPEVDDLIAQKTIEYHNEQQKIKAEERLKRKEEPAFIQEKKTRSHPLLQHRADEQTRQEIRQILKAKINHQAKLEKTGHQSDSNDTMEHPYHESEILPKKQHDPTSMSSDQRIWRCVHCGKEKTKKAFNEFISTEDCLGICTMCFHTSRQRNQNY